MVRALRAGSGGHPRDRSHPTRTPVRSAGRPQPRPIDYCLDQGLVRKIVGGVISSLLANVYLHYVFELWVQQWRQRNSKGDVIVVLYADDFVLGFQHRHEAEQFLNDL